MKKAAYAFFAFWIIMVAFIFFAPQADASSMYAKPVHCGPELDSLIEAWEDEELYPLVALGGVAWMPDGTTVASVTFIVVNADGRNAVVERTSTGYCLLSSGNVVEYNSDIIKDMMDWQ